MTLTIEIPDDTAARARLVAASQGQDLGTFAVALISGAATRAAESPTARRSLMDSAGVGAGRPGAVGEDVDGYLQTMRDEWKERESQRKPLPWDEFFAVMADGIDPDLPPISDYAISREGIYEDHL